jgi:uncharacterized protein DUF4446
VPEDLTSTTGIVALAAGGLALLALLLAALLMRRLRRIESAQRVVLGDTGKEDLVAHAQALQQNFDQLWRAVNGQFEAVGQRLGEAEYRLTRAISQAAVVRYDAYDDLSGRQSSSIALLDEAGNGVVMSSILHRDQARLYVKGVRNGEAEFELSPEEIQAITDARQAGPSAAVASSEERRTTGAIPDNTEGVGGPTKDVSGSTDAGESLA